MTVNRSIETTSALIEGVTESVILKYFDRLNAGQFVDAANLFAPEGALHPPFEAAVVGREAIAAYLLAEAQGIQLFPRQGSLTNLEDGYSQFEIKGKVQTPVFGVNVAWQFILNSVREISSVEVKLLASLQELVKFRR